MSSLMDKQMTLLGCRRLVCDLYHHIRTLMLQLSLQQGGWGLLELDNVMLRGSIANIFSTAVVVLELARPVLLHVARTMMVWCWEGRRVSGLEIHWYVGEV
jgi:hypothetical protein